MTFDYHEPASIEEAVALLAEHGDDAVAMAGGTKIALDLKSGQSPHRHVVALRRVEGLRSVVVRNGSLWLGSMATHSELERSADVNNHHPSITRAFASIANVRIRNQGTIGGNVAAADSSHDPPPVLMVFDAVVHIVGPNGEPRSGPRRRILRRRSPHGSAAGRADRRNRDSDEWDRHAGDVPEVHARLEGGAARRDRRRVAPPRRRRPDLDGPRRPRCGSRRSGQGSRGRGRAHRAASTAALLDEAAGLVGAEVEPVADRRGSAGYKREMARVWVGRALSELARTAA